MKKHDPDFKFSKGILERYYGFDSEVTVPGYISQIGVNAFSDRDRLEKVIIPDTVKSIRKSAFIHCSNLQTVILPSTLREIPPIAFAFCLKLQDITLPDGLKQIGRHAFYYCESLKKVTVPAGVEKIGSHAFENCRSLEEIVLPDGIEIEPDAFYRCSAIKNVVMSDACALALGEKAISTHFITSCAVEDYLEGVPQDPVFASSVGSYLRRDEFFSYYALLCIYNNSVRQLDRLLSIQNKISDETFFHLCNETEADISLEIKAVLLDFAGRYRQRYPETPFF